jgi:hypothetical protein
MPNALPQPEVLHRREAGPQLELALAAAGVLRYLWEGAFGSMLIEVKGGRAYVNGQLVEPAEPAAPPGRQEEQAAAR